MKHLKKLLQTLQPIPSSLVIAFLVVALLGFADATYLTIEHFRNVIPPCTTDGCETVLTSVYSEIGGIPVALFGAVYYLLVIVGAFAYLEGKNEKLLRGSIFLTIFGFIASLGFLFLQAFVIKAFCLYCLVSLATSTILFILGTVIVSKYGNSTDTV